MLDDMKNGTRDTTLSFRMEKKYVKDKVDFILHRQIK